MPRFSFADYAATEVAQASVDADQRLIAEMLAWAYSLGQFWEFDGGFVSYFRSRWESIPLWEERDFFLASHLSREELRTGPVMYIADALAVVPGSFSTVYRTLRQLPGLQAVCAHINFGERQGWALEPVVDLRDTFVPNGGQGDRGIHDWRQ